MFISGYKGNLTEHVLTVAVSLIFTITSLFGFLYLLLWQTYVLRIDVILNSIEIVFIGLEVIFGIICIIVFARYTFFLYTKVLCDVQAANTNYAVA